MNRDLAAFELRELEKLAESCRDIIEDLSSLREILLGRVEGHSVKGEDELVRSFLRSVAHQLIASGKTAKEALRFEIESTKAMQASPKKQS